MDANTLTRAEQAFLLYLETRAVDYGGVVDLSRADQDDRARLDAWARSGFVRSGPIRRSTLPESRPESVAPFSWVELTPEAWAAAGELRRARAARALSARTWRKTDETAYPAARPGDNRQSFQS